MNATGRLHLQCFSPIPRSFVLSQIDHVEAPWQLLLVGYCITLFIILIWWFRTPDVTWNPLRVTKLTFTDIIITSILVRSFGRVYHAVYRGFCYTCYTLLMMRWKLYWIRRLPEDVRQVAYNEYVMQYGKRLTNVHARGVFQNTVIAPPAKQRNHTHPDSAAMRSRASGFMAHVCALLGCEPYYYQMSGPDQKRDQNGARIWYWSKDMHLMTQNDTIKDDDILLMVDVDEYLDMPEILTMAARPVMLYTFQPSTPAAARTEYSYTSRGRVFEYKVNGGATYQHQVWTYAADSLITSYKDGPYFKFVSWHVDFRQLDADHQVILLNPDYTWDMPYDYDIIDGKRLIRLDPTYGEYQLVCDQSIGGPYTAICYPGQVLSAKIPTRILQGLQALEETQSNGVTFATVVKELPNLDTPCHAIIHAFIRKSIVQRAVTVFTVQDSSRSYVLSLADHVPGEDKSAVVSFMSPIIDEAYNPVMSAANERAAIKGRITDLANGDAFPPQYYQYIDEFLSSIFRKHTLRPVTVEEVYRRQSRPSQRAILDRAHLMPRSAEVAQSFLKRECYGDVKVARNITVYAPTPKLDYCQITYSFSEELSKAAWYAFGKTPLQLAQRVAEITKRSVEAVMTDLSRMDGHVNKGMREFELRALLYAFHPDYHAEVTTQQQKQYNIKGYGRFGTKYDTGYARGSGSGETADMNTLDNAFMAYTTFRVAGKTREVAIASLGVYGGDDGITTDVDPKLYTKVCAAFGQVLTPDVVKRGELGVTFLARLYGPDVWFGDTNSMCDLKRTLSKFHTTVALTPTISALDKLEAKCMAMGYTDKYTPIIGDFIQLVEHVSLHDPTRGCPDRELVEQFTNYHTRGVDHPNQYPNFYADWMMDVVHRDLPDADPDLLFKWCESLKDDCTVLLKCLSPPLIGALRPHPKTPGVINGIPYGKKSSASAQHTATKRGKRAGKPRRA